MTKDYSQVDKYAQVIWDYMLMHHTLDKSDAIIALGSNDLRVADRAYEIYKEGFASKIICTGGIAHVNDINNTGWNMTEAEKYRERLLSLGVDDAHILIETEATNSGENARNVKALLEKNNINWKKFIVVGKPWNEKRGFVTFRKQWPEIDILMSSPQMSYEDYMSLGDVPKDVLLNVMIGDFQRIKVYAEMGFQISQDIPESAWQAYEKLVSMGYDKYLVK